METDFDKKDVFARHCGIEIYDVEDGKASGRIQLAGCHLNGLGMVHGGVIFTLADVTFAAAANTKGYPAVAVNVHISYLKSPKTTMLYAHAREVNPMGRLGAYRVDVTDQDGQVVALFEGMAYRMFEKQQTSSSVVK